MPLQFSPVHYPRVHLCLYASSMHRRTIASRPVHRGGFNIESTSGKVSAVNNRHNLCIRPRAAFYRLLPDCVRSREAHGIRKDEMQRRDASRLFSFKSANSQRTARRRSHADYLLFVGFRGARPLWKMNNRGEATGDARPQKRRNKSSR